MPVNDLALSLREKSFLRIAGSESGTGLMGNRKIKSALREWISYCRVKRYMNSWTDAGEVCQMIEEKVERKGRILKERLGTLSPLFWAVLIEIDPEKKFGSVRAFRSYAGLAPRGIRKGGVSLREPCRSNLYLRRALQEYAESAMERSSDLRRRHQNKLRTHSRDVALREISRVVAGRFIKVRNRFDRKSTASPGRQERPLAGNPALAGDLHPGGANAAIYSEVKYVQRAEYTRRKGGSVRSQAV